MALSLRYRATPGLHFATPFVESVAYRRSLKETAFPIHPQTCITRDNVHVQLDGAVYARVEDAYLASYGIDSPTSAITTLAQSAMRKEVCVRGRGRVMGRVSTTTLAESVTRKEAGTLRTRIPAPALTP